MSARALDTDIRVLLAPNPGMMTGAGTNTYLLGKTQVVVVDPGPADDDFMEQILQSVAETGGEVTAIWLTHAHPDHAGNVGRLCKRTGAPLVAWPTPNTVYPIPDLPAPAVPLADGQSLLVEGQAYTVRHTPGHASDHVCFLREADGTLLAGDLVMNGSTVVIARPDGDLRAYLNSLKTLKTHKVNRILPGHGEVIAAGQSLLDAYLFHRAQREQQVLTALSKRPHRPQELLEVIYGALPEALQAVALQQVEAQLHKLAEEGRIHMNAANGQCQLNPDT